jgi:hydroxybutyrate-dimer hydrolase
MDLRRIERHSATAGINMINNLNPGGAKEDRLSLRPGKSDMNLDGALCLRALVTGVDPVTGAPQQSAAGTT